MLESLFGHSRDAYQDATNLGNATVAFVSAGAKSLPAGYTQENALCLATAFATLGEVAMLNALGGESHCAEVNEILEGFYRAIFTDASDYVGNVDVEFYDSRLSVYRHEASLLANNYGMRLIDEEKDAKQIYGDYFRTRCNIRDTDDVVWQAKRFAQFVTSAGCF